MSMAIAGMGAQMPHAVSGASGGMRMPPQQKMTNLFNKIDTGGAGVITQAQFNQAFQAMNPPGPFKAAGADAIWKALDPNGTGQVSQQDFVNVMKNLMAQLRQHHHHHHHDAQAAAQTSAAATQTLNTLL